MAGEIEIRRGTAVGVLTPSTDADFDYINANLRDMDRFEHEHFIRFENSPDLDKRKTCDTAWTLHLRDEIVGYVGLQTPPMMSTLSPLRYVPMLSTTNVNHHPIDFARLSRPILEYVLSQAPAWATDFLSLPLARYEASVRWHEKTMRWHRARTILIGDEPAVLFHLTRKEVSL